MVIGSSWKNSLKRNKNPLTEAILERLLQGEPLQEIFSFDQQVMGDFYQIAYRLFHKKLYSKAADAFFFLSCLNVYQSTYWLGLAMSQHLQKAYDAALSAYAMAQLTDPKNPLPHYHAVDCYLSIGDKKSALASCELAIELGESDQKLKNEAIYLKNKLLTT